MGHPRGERAQKVVCVGGNGEEEPEWPLSFYPELKAEMCGDGRELCEQWRWDLEGKRAMWGSSRLVKTRWLRSKEI